MQVVKQIMLKEFESQQTHISSTTPFSGLKLIWKPVMAFISDYFIASTVLS